MPQGQPAVELPSEDLLAQYRTHVRTDGTQPFADLDQHTALETKPLTDAQRLGRGEYLHPAQEVGKRGRRLARVSRSGSPALGKGTSSPSVENCRRRRPLHPHLGLITAGILRLRQSESHLIGRKKTTGFKGQFKHGKIYNTT